MRAEQWRGLDFYRPSDHEKVVVIGLGHVGSFITYYLARLGVKDITAVDFDFVESHNLPHQFLAESVVANVTEEQKILKTEVLKQTIDFMVRDNNVKYIPKKIQDAKAEIISSGYPNVIFSCVDSMAVRKWIFEHFKDGSLLVDVRTGGQFANLYSIKLGATRPVRYYEDSLYSDEEAAPLPCTGTAIIDVAAAISAEAVNRFRLWQNGKLKIFHTFHDYSTGVHGVMGCESIKVDEPKETNAEDTTVSTTESRDTGDDDITMMIQQLDDIDDEEDEEDEDGTDQLNSRYDEDAGRDR